MRRAQILKATRECVAEAGLAGTTMRRIAQNAGISTGMLTYYYANKRELMLDALAATGSHRFERSREIAGNESSAARMEAYFDVAFPDNDEELTPWAFMLEYWAEATRDPDLRAYHFDHYWSGRDTMAGHIRAAQAAGKVRRDIDPLALAQLFMALRKGLGVEVAFGEEHLPSARARELASYMLSLVGSPGAAEGEEGAALTNSKQHP
jgi:TetR/AcrR family transcriptional regulator, transcriptional repressor of aconitase